MASVLSYLSFPMYIMVAGSTAIIYFNIFQSHSFALLTIGSEEENHVGSSREELGVGLSGRSAYIKPFITVTLSQNHLSEANI